MEVGDNQLILYSYWRSSCAFRVRIALHLKGLKYEYKAVDLFNGEQHNPEFRKLNPLGYVPVLVDGDTIIADSFAIIMYLEEKYPQRPLLPPDVHKKALNYQAANIIFAGIQPLQNLATIVYVEKIAGTNEKIAWTKYHISKGLSALEKLLNDHAGKYATGDEIYLADLFIAPQFHAAKRFNVDLDEFPILARLREAYKDIQAIEEAMPERQPDAPATAPA